MSTNLSHQPCPYVACGSSDAFSYNTEGYGKCHSCGRSYPSAHQKFPWARERYPVKSDERHYQQMNYVPKAIDTKAYIGCRGITKETMEFYGVETTVGSDGKPLQHLYVYPSGGIKFRNLQEKGFHAQGLKSDELFGMNLFNSGTSKIVTITEGEIDAMSAYQMLKSGYTNPVVSVPSATPSRALWTNVKPWLDSFEKIVLSVDSDEAGDALASKIAKLFPNKVYRVIHDKYKDANEFLQANAAKDFKSAWWNAKKYVPDNILNTSDQFLRLYRETPEHQYVPTGIQALDDKIMGLMQGHFTVIKAPTGIGKTEFMRFLEYNLIERGVPFATWHLEETKLRSLLGLVSYRLKRNATRRDLIDEFGIQQDVEDTIVDLTKDEKFYQFYLPDGQGPDELLDQIRFFREACGCQFVFFEPIQDVVAGKNEQSKEEMLADLSVRLSKLAAELNVGIVTIAHTNDEGDIKYCRMIGQRASVIVDLKRDKHSEDVDEKNTTHLFVEKNRPCSLEGNAGAMRFNPETFLLSEKYI